jgi:hypothetical protein
LLELDYLAEALVDLTPVLSEVDGAETEDVVARVPSKSKITHFIISPQW